MNKRNEIGGSIEEFSIEREIGHGGFATVYKAKCLNTNRNVAIKKINKSSISSRGLTDRVRQEVSIHSKLDHPSILNLYTFFEDHHYVYLILELCDRGELYKHIKSLNRVLTENESRQYLGQVVGGMLYLHSQSIMHRDLTLTNLLLDDNGNIKIADFGLATQLARPGDRHTTMCGTPNYISPEVATRSSHGLEADVWSIGCMLYTMLVGQPPFDTHGIKSTLTKVVIGEYKIPSHVSSDACDLISKCLQKNPRERIPLQKILHHPYMNYTKKSEYSGMTDSGLYSMSTMTISTQNTRLPLGTISESDSEESSSGSAMSRRQPPSSRHPSSPPVRMRSNPRDLLASNAGVMGSLKRKFTALPTLHALPAIHGSHRERDVSEERRWQQEEAMSHRSTTSSEGHTNSSHTHSRNSPREVTPCDAIDYANNFQTGNRNNHNHENINFKGNSYENSRPEAQYLPGFQCDPKTHLVHTHNEQSNDRYVRANNDEMNLEQGSNQHRESSRERSRRRGRSRDRSLERYTEPVRDLPEIPHKSRSQERHRVNNERQFSKDQYVEKKERRLHSFCHNSQHISTCDCQQSRGINTESHSLHTGRSRHGYEGTSTSGIGIASNHSSSSKCSNKQYQTTTSNNMLDDIEPVKRTPSPLEDTNTLKDNKSSSQHNPSTTTKRKTGSQSLQQQCSPLSSRRLRPTRQQTNNAILNILENGEVCIEFLANRKGQEKVLKVCRISQDGMRVVLYEPQRGAGVPPADTPPPLPEDGADSIFSYENLPSKHWKKYIYASRFVKLVKSKTPKVTYHSDQAKGILMENSPDPDFEAHFYNGSKVVSAGNNVTVTDMTGISHSLTHSGSSYPSLPEMLQPLYTHAKQIHDHCLYLERVLSEASEKSGLSCFPVIMGRKPSWATGGKLPSTPQGTNSKSTGIHEDKENCSPGSAQSYKPGNNFAGANLGAYEASVLSVGTQGGSGGKYTRAPLGSNNTPNRQDNQVFVPNIGWASKSPAGDLSVDYLDGSGLQVSSRSPQVVFWTRGHTPKTYSTNEKLPPELQYKLSCMQQVMDSLAGKQQSWSAGAHLRTLR
ncbi:unnamed protein product [Meganyctiphanes norvegica]|uniref:Serine/threonine-protein kinase PLK4 n=1 Tax=Meganyctiphanes norvegica TaxID=48144 RepID=A0AAV2QQN3_MEGNR